MPVAMPYQLAGAEFLAARTAALLADEPGLGKSAQAIIAADTAGAGRVLVICPASVVENWRREIEMWSLGLFDFEVLSFDRAGQATAGFDTLIIDEAHYVKTPTAKRTQTLYGPKWDRVGGLAEQAQRVYLLSGTPMPNNPSELWTHLRALHANAILAKGGKPRTFAQFVGKFCHTRDNGFGMQIVGGKNHDQLRAALDGFMLRRTKAEVMSEMPALRYAELAVPGRIDPKALGDEAVIVRKALEEHGVDGLKMVAGHVTTLRRLTGAAKVAGVAAWVRDWLANGGGKIVLFAQHRDVLDGLQAELKPAYAVARVDGSTTDRQRQVDEFQRGDARVFLGQLQAAGTGITLTAASDLVFVESSWVPAENEQAAQRIHRIGQDQACLVRFATLAGSIDEAVQRAIARKMNDIVRVIG
ncbi:DEAD/DEAH box helicase [Aurantimonas sp. A2-1-M11]|uniref:DEAD/DEAH box helicase n=1 Tax=Aurantimonas sp. A2-1-M11 TaxID=3113712 RepID=UPI002F91DE8C